MSARTRSALPGAAAILLALVLAACGGGSAPEESPTSTPAVTDMTDTEPQNDADVEFAQMMIAHHRQAIEMAELAPSRSENLDVLALAGRIEAAQGPEIDVMSAWLESWGEEVAAEDAGTDGMDHGGMDSMGGGEMPGAMTEEDMAELESAAGEQFDRAFLTLMIAHHRGAIEMAEEHAETGSAPAALALSRKIATTQQAEIEEMQDLLEP